MYRIKSMIDGNDVWFQGLIPLDKKCMNVAWTTVADDACLFGHKEAAEGTATVLERGAVEEVLAS